MGVDGSWRGPWSTHSLFVERVISIINFTISFPYILEKVVGFHVGIAGDFMAEGTDVFLIDCVENEVAEGCNGGLKEITCNVYS